MQFFRLAISLIFLVFLSSKEVSAQLPAFSGFWLTPQITAPTAMAGNNAYQVTAHYRRQGFEEGTGYRTLLLSGQVPLYAGGNTHFGTLGLNLMRDESGSSFLFATSGAMLSYLYDASLSQRHHLVGGVQAGYYSRKIDWSQVTTNNQFVNGAYDPSLDPGEAYSENRSQAFLANVGLAYYLTDYLGDQIIHIGAAFMNANRGRFTYLTDTEKQAVPGALRAYAHIRLLSNPFFEVVSDLYWQNKNKVNDVTGGIQLRKGTKPRVRIADHHVGVGLYYSQDHTGILALQLIQPNWLIGISYDVAFGNPSLRRMQNAVEVSLGWRAIRKSGKHQARPYRRTLPWDHKKKLPWQ